MTGFAYLDAVLDQPGSVLAMAHRGGAEHPELRGLENTLFAFRHAVALGYHYLETDVHTTRDGHLVACHDEDLARVAGTPGVLAELLLDEVAHARIGGEHPVPRLEELLEEFPDRRFNVDVKSDGAVEVLASLVEAAAAHERLCVGSFSRRRLDRFRALTGGRVATSAAPAEVAAFLSLPVSRLRRVVADHRIGALQVPRRRGALPVVTRSLVRRAHAAGVHVHVWTVDRPADMAALLDLGVDGLITDRTDLLKDVLVARGQWRDHA